MADKHSIYRNVSLALGQSCFVYCPGCYNNGMVHANPQNFPVLKPDEIVSFVKKVKEQTGLSEITISGGDPLTYDELPELLEKLHRLSFFVKLDTLGTALVADAQAFFPIAKMCKKVKFENIVQNIGLLGIPLDGSTEEIISKFRTGRKNILKETFDVLELAQRYDVPICINVVVHKFNLEDLENIVLGVKNFKNIKKIQFFQFCPTGELATKNKNLFEIEAEIFISKTNFLMEKYPHYDIDAKLAMGRGRKYFFINRFGLAYCADVFEQNKVLERKLFGNIKNPDDFQHILQNGLFIN